VFGPGCVSVQDVCLGHLSLTLKNVVRVCRHVPAFVSPVEVCVSVIVSVCVCIGLGACLVLARVTVVCLLQKGC